MRMCACRGTAGLAREAKLILAICIYRWIRPRMQCRRLHVYTTDPSRPQGVLMGGD